MNTGLMVSILMIQDPLCGSTVRHRPTILIGILSTQNQITQQKNVSLHQPAGMEFGMICTAHFSDQLFVKEIHKLDDNYI